MDIGEAFGGLLILCFVAGVAIMIAIWFAIAGAMVVLAFLTLFLFRDCVVALWDGDLHHDYQVLAKFAWAVLVPVIASCLVFYIPYALLEPKYPDDAFNTIIPLSFAVVYFGAYVMWLNTTTPRSQKWVFFQLRQKQLKTEQKLQQIEHQMQRDIHMVIGKHRRKHWQQSLRG